MTFGEPIFPSDSILRQYCYGCHRRLHSTASSHKRVMVIEVMGHKAGWIALYSGMAGGGDVILIPEIPYNIHRIGETILNRLKKGKPYSIVVVAEGIQTDGRKRAAEYIAQEIEYETGIETRETVLGYIRAGRLDPHLLTVTFPHVWADMPRTDCQRAVRAE